MPFRWIELGYEPLILIPRFSFLIEYFGVGGWVFICIILEKVLTNYPKGVLRI